MGKNLKDLIVTALKEGRPYTFTEPEGGDLASMRKAVKHGQTLTISPVNDPVEIRVGDMVMVRWANWYIFHIVGDIQEGKYLIVNSLGKVNGWVEPQEILGRVTEVIDPEPRPSVPEMLDELEGACIGLIKSEGPPQEDAERLMRMVELLRWYAGRMGEARWDVMPRSNVWSFAQNLWRFTHQLKKDTPAEGRVAYFTDQGLGYAGLASHILALLEYGETDWPY